MHHLPLTEQLLHKDAVFYKEQLRNADRNVFLSFYEKNFAHADDGHNRKRLFALGCLGVYLERGEIFPAEYNNVARFLVSLSKSLPLPKGREVPSSQYFERLESFLPSMPWKTLAVTLYRVSESYIRPRLSERIFNPRNEYYPYDLPRLPEKIMPLLLLLVDVADRHLQLSILVELYYLPFETAVALVDTAYEQANADGKILLLRQYTCWAWLHGRPDLLEQRAANETDERVCAAIELARARSRIDWPWLFERHASYEANQPVFADPLREKELQELREQIYDARQSYINPLREVIGSRYEPLFLFVLLKHCSPVMFRRLHCSLDVLEEIYSSHVAEAVQLAFPRWEHIDKWGYYKAFSERYKLPIAYHVEHILQQEGPSQKYAMQKLSEHGEEALPACQKLLKDKSATIRTVAARVLQCITSPKAVPFLQEAMRKERSKKCKQALEEAIGQCSEDPNQMPKLGIYRRNEVLEETVALEQLREMLYAPATPESWVRTCDLLNRVRGSSALDVAVDYLQGHGLTHWQKKDRILPWGWEEPQLQALGTKSELWWVPVSTFFLGQHAPFLEEALGQLEKKGQKRRLPHHLLDDFLGWLEVAWHWCERKKIPLSWLDAQLDGGCSTKYTRPDSTSLKLFREFGLQLNRGPAFSNSLDGEGIRWMWVRLPNPHPFRDMYPLRSGKRYLDLRDVYKNLQVAREECFPPSLDTLD